MVSAYTDLLRLEKQATGENSNTWGTRLSARTTEMIEDGIGGYVAVPFTSSNVTLSANNGLTDQARMAIIKATGTLSANVDMIVPTTSKKYTIWNATTGTFTLTVKTSAGTGVVVQQGAKADLFCDGTNVEQIETATNKLFIPVAAMSSLTTNGAAAAVVELTPGRPELVVYDFDGSTIEAVQFSIIMPDDWDLGTITYKVHWTANATDTDSAVFSLAAVAISDSDAIDVAYGTAIDVTDAIQSTAYELLVSADSSAMTVAGTPLKGDSVFYKLSRNATDGSDTAAEDARVIGITITYGVLAGGIQ